MVGSMGWASGRRWHVDAICRQAVRSATAIAAFLMLCLALMLPSQAATPGEIPAPLKGLKRADGQCRRDEGRPASGPTVDAPPRVPADLSCAITASELASRTGKPDLVLIDVRTPSEFQSFHIQDAINLDASLIKSKPFWRDKSVVLIGSGKAEGELYASCAELKSRGYAKARVLRGGLAGWLAGGQTLVGHVPQLADMVRLSAVELWQESREVENVVLQTAARNDMADPLAAPPVVPATTAAALKQALDRRARELKQSPFATLVVVAEPTLAAKDIEGLVRAMVPVPVLFYTDSAANYRKRMAEQDKVWAAHARGPKPPPGCRG